MSSCFVVLLARRSCGWERGCAQEPAIGRLARVHGEGGEPARRGGPQTGADSVEGTVVWLRESRLCPEKLRTALSIDALNEPASEHHHDLNQAVSVAVEKSKDRAWSRRALLDEYIRFSCDQQVAVPKLGGTGPNIPTVSVAGDSTLLCV